ncbi:MAG: heme-binding protein [Myxococcales bacterium]
MKNKRISPFVRSLTSLALLTGCGGAALAASPNPPRPTGAARAETKAAAIVGPVVAVKKSLTREGARLAIESALGRARELNTTGVIAVVDEGGNLMALERLDNTFSAGASISIGKARTAALFKKPTRAFEEIIKNGRTAMTALSDFTPLVGGFPIVSDGQIIGGIGVSGAASADQDEELARAGARALAITAADLASLAPPAAVPAPAAAPAPVTLFSSEQVTNAFAKGVPLLETSSFKVHASRREGPGKVEIHTLDTDIAYVQEGTATVVTGGTAVNAKTIEPNELRGDSIQGGETVKLKKGDVIVIPKGVPHWFKEVSLPFTYYVVKVH